MALDFSKILNKIERGDIAAVSRITGKTKATVSRCVNDKRKPNGDFITSGGNRKAIHRAFKRLLKSRSKKREILEREEGIEHHLLQENNNVLNKFNISA